MRIRLRRRRLHVPPAAKRSAVSERASTRGRAPARVGRRGRFAGPRPRAAAARGWSSSLAAALALASASTARAIGVSEPPPGGAAQGARAAMRGAAACAVRIPLSLSCGRSSCLDFEISCFSLIATQRHPSGLHPMHLHRQRRHCPPPPPPPSCTAARPSVIGAQLAVCASRAESRPLYGSLAHHIGPPAHPPPSTAQLVDEPSHRIHPALRRRGPLASHLVGHQPRTRRPRMHRTVPFRALPPPKRPRLCGPSPSCGSPLGATRRSRAMAIARALLRRAQSAPSPPFPSAALEMAASSRGSCFVALRSSYTAALARRRPLVLGRRPKRRLGFAITYHASQVVSATPFGRSPPPPPPPVLGVPKPSHIANTFRSPRARRRSGAASGRGARQRSCAPTGCLGRARVLVLCSLCSQRAHPSSSFSARLAARGERDRARRERACLGASASTMNEGADEQARWRS